VIPMGLNRHRGRPMEERMLDPARLRADEAWDLLRSYYDRWDLALPRWLSARLLPCYRHQSELREGLRLDRARDRAGRHVDTIGNEYGWQEVRKTPEEVARFTAIALGRYDGSLNDFYPAAGAEHALRDVLGLCRREDIPVALLVMPESGAYRALYPAETWAAVDTFLAELADEYGLEVIDARTWVSDDGFWDGHHLDSDGAAVFTDPFGREAVRPLLRRVGAASFTPAGRPAE